MESLDALDAGGGALLAPKLGVVTLAVRPGDVVRPGALIGVLRVLNRGYRVVVPAGVAGLIEETAGAAREVAVGYRDRLVRVSSLEGAALTGAGPGARAAEAEVDGVAVRAPITGIFYRRASPGAPPYVAVGQAVTTGQTVGLIEVMKTFNPVVYTGAPGTVASIRADDRQEVGAGQILLVVA